MSTRQSHRSLALICVALAAALCACTSDVAPDKGAEDEVPLDGKLDSFRSPTDHGTLRFDRPNEAALDESALFHVWSFTLSDDAEIDVSTQPITANVDTVMYLYRKTTSGQWGSYIARNDDYDNQMWSRLTEELRAGDYRILVKGYKASIRGSFAVNAECTGAGCPSSGGTCEGEPAKLPAEQRYDSACWAKLNETLGAWVETRNSLEVAYADRCTLEPIERRAVEQYFDYFENVLGWSFDLPETELVLTVSTTGMGDAGSVVEVTNGGDEMTVTFVYDRAGEIMLAYHDEESPTEWWYCGDTDSSEISPEPDCVGSYLEVISHDADNTRDESGSVRVEDASTLSPAVAAAVTAWAEIRGVDGTDTVRYEGRAWEAGGGEAAELTLSATGVTTETVVSSSSDYATWLYGGSTSTESDFICRQL